MYLPKHFSQDDETKIRELIERNSFATVLSFPKDERVFINHLPLIFIKKEGEEKTLIGHMSRSNPQWKHFLENSECTVIINGEHTYISPRWYKSGRDVPTWNYVVAHLHGKVEVVEDFKGQIQILKQLSDHYEGEKWKFQLPDDLANENALTDAIVSFKFHPEIIEGKFKLSQNRSQEDRDGVMEGLLRERTDEMSEAIRKLMCL